MTINTSGTTDNVVLTSTDSSSASAPDLVLYRNTAVSDEDTFGVIEFKSKNGMVPSSATPFTYNAIYSRLIDGSANQSVMTFATNKGNGSGAFIHPVTMGSRGSNNSATGTLIINPDSEFTVADYNLQVEGTTGLKGQTTITSIPSVGSDTDKFLMSNSGIVSFATGAEVRSYIGAGTGSGNVSNTGTPANNQVAIWTNATTIEGDADLTFDGTNLTVGGSVSLTAGSLSISGDGSNAATLTETGAGTLTIAAVDDLILDSGSDISIDAGGNDIRLKVNGVEYAKFKDDSDDLAMFSSIQDKDILFKGNDGGSTITALTLDMSNGGSATFRDDIDFGGKLTQTGTGANTFAGNVTISGTKDLTVGGTTYVNNVQARTSAGLKVGNDDFSGFVQVADNGQVNFDSGNSEIHFLGSGTTFGKVFKSGDNLYINNPIQDKDIIFSGNDNGSSVTALTLDMSDNGRALFRGPLNVGEDIAGSITLKDSGTSYASFYKYSGSLFIQAATSGETVTMGAPTTFTQNLRVMGFVNANNYQINGSYGSDGQVMTSTGSGVAWEDVSAATNNYVDSVSFATGTGILTLGRNGLSDLTVDLDGRYLELTGGTLTGTLQVGTTNPVKLINQSYGGELGLYYGTTNHWKQYHYSDNSLRFNYNGSGADEIIIDTSGNATFAGDITVSGGDITLVGTGRIQGVDTVSASTDAANKAYVDAHPSGTVTSVATGSGLTGGTITGSGTISVDYGSSGLVADAPGGSGNPDADDLILVGQDSSGSGETRSFAITDLPFSNNQGTVTAVNSGNTNTLSKSGTTSITLTPNTGAVSSSSSNLATGAQIQTAINTAVTGVLSFQGTWNASTNSPTLSSGSGTPGYYYIVGTAGSTNLDGITDWAVGDWAVFSDLATDAWQKIDNTQVGNVTGTGVNNRLAIWNGTTAIDSDGDFYVDGDTIYTTNLEASGKVNTAEVESSGTILLDAAADITIDAGGSDIILSDDGTIFGTFSTSSNFQIRSRINNADMFLRGVDNGTEFNALQLDMSEAGDAYFNRHLHVGGDIYGKNVNADFSRIYRMGGIFFTWDSDSYGTDIQHSITSTLNGTYTDDITINSYSSVRVNIDSNNNDSNSTFSIGNHGTGSSGSLFTLDESGNTDMISGNVQGKFAVKSTAVHGSYDFYNDGTTYLNGAATVDDTLTVTSIANASSDTDKFLVSDSGVLKYRTGAQVRSDIGAGTGSGTMSSWIIQGDSGNTSVSNGDTVDIAGGSGITTAESGKTVTVTNTGVLSVSAGSNISVSSGTGAITIAATNTTYSMMTTGTLGLGKLFSNTTQTTPGNSVTTTSGRTYGIQKNSSDQLVVNVPWSDTTGSNNYVDSLSWNTGNGILTVGRSGLSDLTVDLDGRYATSSGVTSVGSGAGLTGGTITSTGTLAIDYAGSDNLVLAASSGTIGNTSSILFNQSNNAYRALLSDIGLSKFNNDSSFITGITISTATGITGGGTGTSFTLNVDLNEFSTTTNSAQADFFPIVNSGGSGFKIAASDIDLSSFNNDAGFVTSSGVTSIATGNSSTLTKTGTTAVTLTPNTAAVTNGGASLATGDQIYDFVGAWIQSFGGGDVTGNGLLSQSVALTLNTVNSNVGSFTNANITVDAKGRVTAASSGSGGSGVTGSGTANFLPKWTSSSAIGNSEISDTGSVMQLGLDASNNSTLYLDTTNRKVGFRTTSPGAAFDVNGTMRVRNQLNVGNTTEQNLYVDGNGAAGGKYVKMGNYGGSSGNYFGITSAANQPKFSAAFGNAGKIVQDKRIFTVKIAASALNSANTTSGKIIIPAAGANTVIWPTNIFIHRGSGSPGNNWPSSTSAGCSFFFCPSDVCSGTSTRYEIAIIAGGVCSRSGEWYWGRPVPLPSINENPNVAWDGLKNAPLRFRTANSINSATTNWYVRIEYLKINVTAGFINNVDSTVT